MTTHEKMMALADRIEARVAEGRKKNGQCRAAVHYDEAPLVIAALRSGSFTVEELAQLRCCIETLRPYTSRPIGGEGSASRREQDDRAAAYAEAIQIITKRTEG